MDKKQILNKISSFPNWLNIILLKLNIFGGRVYGRAYIKYKKELQANNYYKYDNTNDLLNIVNFAIKNVPYYRNKYGNLEIKSRKEFQEKIGFIDKDIVMQKPENFIADNIDHSKYIKGTTGGTSGKPLQLIIPKNRHIFELATMHTMWENTGWKYNKRAVIRNTHLPKNRDYIINPITKEYIFDGFRLDNEYMHVIYNLIKKKKIKFIHAYPSVAYQFSVFLKNSKLDTSFIKAFFSGSENIFDYQKELIQNKLGIRFYNWYGHSEKLVLGGYCKESDFYHLEPTYGYFELIDNNEDLITTVGEKGEIVGTTLKNNGMPLIKYKTGDFAEYLGNACPHCKRQLPIIKNIQGRWSGEKIYNKDGTFVTTTALNLHNDIFEVINGHQYIHPEKGKLDILIIKSSNYTSVHESRILEHYKTKFNTDMEISIKYVDKLIKQPNGKFLHLISNVKE